MITSAMDPRLDTGGWLTLTESHYCLSSRQGLAPCKMRRALLGAITPGMSALGKAKKGFEKEEIFEDSRKR